MKNIAQKTLQQNESVRRINQITKTFRSANGGNRARMLETLSIEINQIQDSAVKNWLIKFNSILRGIK